MRSFIASADRTSRAVGPARSRCVCRSLPAPRLLRLRLWWGYSGSRGTAFEAACLYLRDQCRDAGPNKTAARRLEGGARYQPRRPRGPRGGGLAGNTRVAGADGSAGEAARGDNDCHRAEAPRLVKGDLRTDLAALAQEAPKDATLVIFHTAVLA